MQSFKGNLLSKKSQRCAGVRMAYCQAGHPAITCGRECLRQSSGKSRLCKSKSRIHPYGPRARTRHNGLHIPFDPAVLQLFTIAFQVIEAADKISYGLGFPYGPRDLSRNPRRSAVPLQSSIYRCFNLTQCHFWQNLLPAALPALGPDLPVGLGVQLAGRSLPTKYSHHFSK